MHVQYEEKLNDQHTVFCYFCAYAKNAYTYNLEKYSSIDAFRLY